MPEDHSSLPNLGYGAKSIRLPLEESEAARVLAPASGGADANGSSMAAHAVSHPQGSLPLVELARGARSVVILVSGRDRVTRADVFMPPILSALREAGVESRHISVIAATGTHLPFAPEDLPLLVGPNFPADIPVTGHDCRDETRLTHIGSTSRGNEVRVNSLALECELKILTGRITHHYFAGFTAGRKAVLPGIAAHETILFNHRLVVSGTGADVVPTTVANGRLTGNPVHEDMLEAAAFFRPDFVVNTTLGAGHEVLGVFAGNSIQAHLAGCALVDHTFTFRHVPPVDLVVASCGGAPYDCSFIQAIKTIFNCHHAVRDGGVMLLLAECPEGIKKGFHDWARFTDREELTNAVRKNYDLAGHNSVLLRLVLERIHVVLVSSLDKDQPAHLGFHAASTAEVGWREAVKLTDSARPRTLVIPSGNVTVIASGPPDPVLEPELQKLRRGTS